ncbi:MAG: NmrA family NAD(P)-binding protein [Acidobacteriota bacterium]|nr:NmrA family NAD(P)-binding protein [Acidobacteriota bacterium]
MKVLVLGATGSVGSVVVQNLLKAGASVVALTRSADKAKNLPAGVEARIGDLNDPYQVGDAFKGVEAVFLLNAVSSTETQEGLFALEWVKRHGVKKLVHLSVQHVDRAPHLPHFAGKIAIEMAIKQSGIDFTILQPNNFYQNDYWFKDVMLQYGAYPQPLGSVGTDRVDIRDIADAAAKALEGGGASGKTVILAGPSSETGASTAATWSKHLGKPIAYLGDDLEAWEQGSLKYLPPWMVFDFKMMYAWFQQHGLKAGAGEREATEKLLGHPMRTFDAFAKETASQWKA